MNRIACLLLALGAASACARNRSPNALMPTCTGERVAAVANSGSVEIEVLARRGKDADVVLGRVRAGSRNEFEIPEGTVDVVARIPPGTPRTSLTPIAPSVKVSYRCQ